jgi:hypothetical protein
MAVTFRNDWETGLGKPGHLHFPEAPAGAADDGLAGFAMAAAHCTFQQKPLPTASEAVF